MDVQIKTLKNGVEIPEIGFGVFFVEEGAKLAEAVKTAIKTGYVVLIWLLFMAMKKVLEMA